MLGTMTARQLVPMTYYLPVRLASTIKALQWTTASFDLPQDGSA